MSTITLYPPLNSIEQRLFAVPDDLLLRLAQDDASVPDSLRRAVLADNEALEKVTTLRDALNEEFSDDLEETTPLPEPPAFIKTLIRHKVAASRADFGRFPEAGQLIQLMQLPTPSGIAADLLFAAPLVALLDAQDKTSRVWHGWLVAQEVQYAGFWDLLLQPEDEPFDPLCGMVQIWNPVQLYLPDDFKTKTLGRLSAARMLAVRALALEYVQGDPVMPRSRPGFIAMRSTLNDFSIVTGTPLGSDSDPRHAYQHCYHHVAELLNEPVRAWQDDSVTTFADKLKALCAAIADAWHQATDNWPQPVAPVAHAMSGQTRENVLALALRDDLQLTVMQVDERIDLTLVYRGNVPLNVIVIDDGEQARSTTLDADMPSLDYSGLAINADNRLLVEFTDGHKISLPLSI